MEKVINVEKCFGMFSDTFSPKIVGELNGQNVLLVRCEGDKVPWHTHDDEDEMFFVLEGTLDVFERDKSVTLHPGEFIIGVVGECLWGCQAQAGKQQAGKSHPRCAHVVHNQGPR